MIFAQQGRYDDANAALRNSERLAAALGADDILALAYMRQAAKAVEAAMRAVYVVA